MKRSLIAFIVLASVCHTLVMGSEIVVSTSSSKAILNIALPTSIEKLLDSMGKPSASESPDHGYSSHVGKLYHWDLKQRDVVFYALADDYDYYSDDMQPSYSGDVRFIKLMSYDGRTPYDTVYNLTLNHSKLTAIQNRFKDKMVKCGRIGYNFFEGNTAYWYVDNEIFTYFIIGKSGVLVGIIQSTFWLEGAG